MSAKVTKCGVKQTGADDYVILLEDLEFTFPKEQLKHIRNDWNDGATLDHLVETYKRPEDEMFLALFHLARERKITRTIGKRQKNTWR